MTTDQMNPSQNGHLIEAPDGRAKVTEAQCLAGLKAARDQQKAADNAVDAALVAQEKAKKAHHDAEAATKSAMDKAATAAALVAGWMAALRRAS